MHAHKKARGKHMKRILNRFDLMNKWVEFSYSKLIPSALLPKNSIISNAMCSFRREHSKRK